MNDSISVVITTVETSDQAEQLSAALLDQSLAACIQIDGPIVSHYRWKGKLEKASEFRLMIKTSREVWDKLEAILQELHPYDEPEIILIPIEASSRGYRQGGIEQTS